VFRTLRRLTGRNRSVGADGPIHLCAEPTAEDFDPEAYLYVNADVDAEAPATDRLSFARQHFDIHGRREGRRQLRTSLLPAVADLREAKMQWLFRRSPGSLSLLEPYTTTICDKNASMHRAKGDPRLPVPFARVSAHDYDSQLRALFDSGPTRLFLDLGAGLRSLYWPNIVYTEIAALPSTDVLCFGDKLPFDDDVFDGVVALAVLEHVPDPFAVVEELVRVVRPGCQVIVDWPFLVPVHGYPEHYFNATPQGARDAFERLPDVSSVRLAFPSFLHPAYSLRWMLDEWLHALPEERQSSFAELRVSDILAHPPEELETKPWSRLPEDRIPTIAAGTRLFATKDPKTSPES